jgi:hypothetical protein
MLLNVCHSVICVGREDIGGKDASGGKVLKEHDSECNQVHFRPFGCGPKECRFSQAVVADGAGGRYGDQCGVPVMRDDFGYRYDAMVGIGVSDQNRV